MFYMQIYRSDAPKQGTSINFQKEFHIFRDNLQLFSFFLAKKFGFIDYFHTFAM